MQSQINVLIIEDEALIAESLQLMLRSFGYCITDVCYSFETALQTIDTGNFDLVLTDINLGDGIGHRSGFELIRHLKTHTLCPFIFLTAFDDPDTIQRAVAFRPSAYLTKPVNAATLYASVQIAVENFQQQQPGDSSLVRPPHPDYIYVKVGKRMIKVLWAAVYCLESVKNYVLLQSRDFNFAIPIRSSLVQVIDEMIPPCQRRRFVRISRSMAIDKAIVTSVSDVEIQTLYGTFPGSAELRRTLTSELLDQGDLTSRPG